MITFCFSSLFSFIPAIFVKSLFCDYLFVMFLHLRASSKKSKDCLICDNLKHSVKKEKASLQNWRSNHSRKFVVPDRCDYVAPDCKPRIKRPSWHGLRHLYFQENRRRLLAEGGMSERQIDTDMSERMDTTATMSRSSILSF